MSSFIVSILAISLYASVTVGGVLNRGSGYLHRFAGLDKDHSRIHIPVVSGGNTGRLDNGGVERFPGVHPSGGGDIDLNHNRGVNRFPAVSGGRGIGLHVRGLQDRAPFLGGVQGRTGLDGGVYPGKRSGICQGLWSANGSGRTPFPNLIFYTM